MTKPIKTLLLDAVETALKKITGLTQWKRGQGIPTDQDTAVYPWGCFFDEPETKSPKNRNAWKEFDLVIQIWFKVGKASTLSDQMDAADADVENALLNDSAIKVLLKSINPTTLDKLYVDDLETGILQATYHIAYAHKWKDAYSPAEGQ